MPRHAKTKPSRRIWFKLLQFTSGAAVLLGLFADSAMEGDLSRVWTIALVTLVYLCVETFFAFLLD